MRHRRLKRARLERLVARSLVHLCPAGRTLCRTPPLALAVALIARWGRRPRGPCRRTGCGALGGGCACLLQRRRKGGGELGCRAQHTRIGVGQAEQRDGEDAMHGVQHGDVDLEATMLVVVRGGGGHY